MKRLALYPRFRSTTSGRTNVEEVLRSFFIAPKVGNFFFRILTGMCTKGRLEVPSVWMVGVQACFKVWQRAEVSPFELASTVFGAKLRQEPMNSFPCQQTSFSADSCQYGWSGHDRKFCRMASRCCATTQCASPSIHSVRAPVNNPTAFSAIPIGQLVSSLPCQIHRLLASMSASLNGQGEAYRCPSWPGPALPCLKASRLLSRMNGPKSFLAKAF